MKRLYFSVIFMTYPLPALAQLPEINDLLPADSPSVTGRIIQFAALLTVLSIAPGLLIMVTSFTRIIIALSFLRSGLGLQSTPANLIMVSLALFLTFFVMAPVFESAKKNGLDPFISKEINEQQAYERITEPFRTFMVSNVRENDLALFEGLARQRKLILDPAAQDDFRILIPAFMISELRRGFEIGFLIILPFLVIDLIVAVLTMSMGMMMLPPTIISLPFKILFFVLIDGWHILVGSLINSFTIS